jgi:phytoene dehydrogenase-like protein
MGRSDVVVAGAGLGGLMTACLLAQQGLRVTVVERASAAGGRARTQVQGGFSLNLGPHALFRLGEAARVLRTLGVRPRGRMLPNEAWGIAGARLAPLPGGPVTWLRTSWLRGTERLALLSWFLRLRRIAADQGGSWGERVADAPDGVRRLLDTLARTATYAWPVDPLDGPTVARQVLLALRGVLYLDGGWQTLVDGLLGRADALGVRVVPGEEALEVSDGLRTATAHHAADHVVLALPAPSLRRLGVPLSPCVPARMSCLDLGGPVAPRAGVVLGVGEPLYLSEHTRAAALAPAGQRLIHLGRYLAPAEEPDRAELEQLADRVVPGWRGGMGLQRYTPALTVAHALPIAGATRTPSQLDSGVWVVGDTVEAPGMLADAVAASAAQAARGILAARRGTAMVRAYA